MPPTPANDPRRWSKEDDFLGCPCGSLYFVARHDHRDGRHYLECRRCDHDMTMQFYDALVGLPTRPDAS